MCEHGAVRLVGGLTRSTGRLEFCAHGIWGRVCNHLQYWGSDNTRVVCRQLQFSDQGEVHICNTASYQCQCLKERKTVSVSIATNTTVKKKKTNSH